MELETLSKLLSPPSITREKDDSYESSKEYQALADLARCILVMGKDLKEIL